MVHRLATRSLWRTHWISENKTSDKQKLVCWQACRALGDIESMLFVTHTQATVYLSTHRHAARSNLADRDANHELSKLKNKQLHIALSRRGRSSACPHITSTVEGSAPLTFGVNTWCKFLLTCIIFLAVYYHALSTDFCAKSMHVYSGTTCVPLYVVASCWHCCYSVYRI